MNSPFDNMDKAFDPFFTDVVAFSAMRPDGVHSGTLHASVTDEGYEEIFDETAATSSRIGLLHLLVRKCDWAKDVSTPPQSGDRFTSPLSGKVYALKTVSHFSGDTWTITAREVAP